MQKVKEAKIARIVTRVEGDKDNRHVLSAVTLDVDGPETRPRLLFKHEPHKGLVTPEELEREINACGYTLKNDKHCKFFLENSADGINELFGKMENLA